MQDHDNQLTVIFVYGTLKRHDCRHYLLKDSIYLGEAVTEPHYRLYNLGSYPGLIEVAKGFGISIEGELYAVTPECLFRLDEEEGVAEQLYERKEISCLSPHREVDSESYFHLGDVSEANDIGESWNVANSR